MVKKELQTTIVAGIFLGIIGGIAIVYGAIHTQVAKASISIEDVLGLTLNSHTKWNTLRGEALITFYGPKGEKQIFIDKFDIAQPNKANIKSFIQDGTGQNTIWISDGSLSYSLDETSKTYTSMKLPTFSYDYSRLPKTLSEVTSDSVYNHPFALVIPLPIREYIFPEWFPQGGGDFSILGEEIILGRPAWIVEHQKGTDFVKTWIDQQTGVILKYLQETNGKPTLNVEFTQIEFNIPIASAIFMPPSDLKNLSNSDTHPYPIEPTRAVTQIVITNEKAVPPAETGSPSNKLADLAVETPQSVSPSGQLLIEQYNPPRVFLLSADGKSVRQVLDFAPAKVSIAPDGRKLAYLSNGVITILDLISQQTTQINDEESGNMAFDNIAWSPDGTQFGYGCYSGATGTLELCLLNILNGTKQQVTHYLELGLKTDPGLDGAYMGNWSADGSQIVYVIRTLPGNGGNAWGIIQIYRPQDGTIQTVIDERNVAPLKNLTSPSISPDGKSILFQAKAGDHTAIFRIQADGTRLERLTAESLSIQISNPMWDSTGRYFIAQAQEPHSQKIRTQPTVFSYDGQFMYQLDVDGAVKSWIGNSR